jgi:NAD(P)-dependent dehydrogenase (short-subunit alcohol dehydrogenase family)
MSLFDMTGQIALITGSSRGIGKATAEAMAEQGAKVVISSRKQDVCDATAAEINARHGADTAISRRRMICRIW